MTGIHRQQIADAQLIPVLVWLTYSFVRKEGDHQIVQRQYFFLNSKTDSGRSEAFAERMHNMRRFTFVGCPPAFGYRIAMPDNHEAVHRIELRFHPVNEGQNGIRNHALRFGGTLWEVSGGLSQEERAPSQQQKGKDVAFYHQFKLFGEVSA